MKTFEEWFSDYKEKLLVECSSLREAEDAIRSRNYFKVGYETAMEVALKEIDSLKCCGSCKSKATVVSGLCFNCTRFKFSSSPIECRTDLWAKAIE